MIPFGVFLDFPLSFPAFLDFLDFRTSGRQPLFLGAGRATIFLDSVTRFLDFPFGFRVFLDFLDFRTSGRQPLLLGVGRAAVFLDYVTCFS